MRGARAGARIGGRRHSIRGNDAREAEERVVYFGRVGDRMRSEYTR
jgi:hypothetical protein